MQRAFDCRRWDVVLVEIDVKTGELTFSEDAEHVFDTAVRCNTLAHRALGIGIEHTMRCAQCTVFACHWPFVVLAGLLIREYAEQGVYKQFITCTRT